MRFIGLWVGLCVSVFGLAFSFSYAGQMIDRVQKLTEENHELRLRDANRARIQKLHAGQLQVPIESVQNAAYDMGTDLSILWDVAQTERGGPIYEMGHGGKTAFIWLSVPANQTQQYEAARSLNKSLWAWAMADPQRKKEAIKALGKSYTAPVNARKWAQKVQKLEARRDRD